MIIRAIIKIVVQTVYRPLVMRYLARPRRYRYQDIDVEILPGVFHPGLFFSTKFLLQFLAGKELSGQRFLELGAGSGLISLWAARRGAKVTASDVSKTAVENIRRNARQNQVVIEVIESDLFENFPTREFDLIVINPPYFPYSPKSEFEKAWFCGKDFGYFRKLFRQLGNFPSPRGKVFMILSDECDLPAINEIAARNHFKLFPVWRKKIWWEENIIFEIRRG